MIVVADGRSPPKPPILARISTSDAALVQQKMGQKFRAIARRYMRWKLPQQQRKQRIELDKAFEAARHFAAHFEHSRYPALSTLFNIGLYFLIAEKDIQAVKIDALTHPDEWTRKLQARIILLTIYEWDADKVSGKALRDALDLVGASEELRTEATNALRALRLVQKAARAQFSFIRNVAIAHRDPDALAQYRAIRALDIEAVIKIAAEFYVGINLYLVAMTKILNATRALDVILRQREATSPSASA